MSSRQAACEPCRKAKLACDHIRPVCSRCRHLRRPGSCVYRASPFRRKRAPGSSPQPRNNPPPRYLTLRLDLRYASNHCAILAVLSRRTLRLKSHQLPVPNILTQGTWVLQATLPSSIKYSLMITMIQMLSRSAIFRRQPLLVLNGFR